MLFISSSRFLQAAKSLSVLSRPIAANHATAAFVFAEKIGPIAERFGVEPSDILDNLVHCRAMTSDHQVHSPTHPPPLPSSATHECGV